MLPAKHNLKNIETTLDLLPLPTLISRLSDGLILYENEMLSPMLGYPPYFLAGKKTPDFYADPADRPKILAALEKKGKLVDYEAQGKRHTGEIFTFLINMRPIVYKNYQALITTFSDVTNDKQMYEKLALIIENTYQVTGGDFFEALTKTLTQGFQAKFAFVSEIDEKDSSWFHLLNFCESGRQQKTFAYSAVATPCEHVIRDGATHYSDGVYKLFPGDEWLAEAKIESYMAAPVYDTHGKPIGHLGIMDDKPMPYDAMNMTLLQGLAARAGAELYRMRNEEQSKLRNESLDKLVKKRTQKLRQSEEKYRLITEVSSEGIYMATPDGIMTFINEAHARIFGYTKSEVIGKNFSKFYTPKQLAVAQSLFANLMKDDGNNQVVEGEIMAKHKQGHEIPIYFSAVAIKKSGKTVGLTGVVRDITEKKGVEYMRSKFVTDSAHELRTPLSVIKINLDLLQHILQRTEAPATQHSQEIIEEMKTEVKRLEEMSGDLSLLAQFDAKVQSHPPRNIRLDRLLKTVVQTCQSLAKANRVSLEMSEFPSIMIKANTKRVRKMLINPVANAVHYGNFGGWVEVSLRLSARRIQIIVVDNGPGISEADLPRIFERFFRADSSRTGSRRDPHGSGLGLAISKEVAQELGGDISVTSTVGQGTTLTITLPRNQS